MPKDIAQENAALRAEIERLRAREGHATALPHEGWRLWLTPVLGGTVGVVLPLLVYMVVRAVG